MIAADQTISFISYFINGEWVHAPDRKHGRVTNPATGGTLAEVPFANAEDVDRAVRAAHAAFPAWRDTPVVDRVQVLYRYKALLEKHLTELAATLTRENGKTAEDAKAEVRRAVQMVE